MCKKETAVFSTLSLIPKRLFELHQRKNNIEWYTLQLNDVRKFAAILNEVEKNFFVVFHWHQVEIKRYEYNFTLVIHNNKFELSPLLFSSLYSVAYWCIWRDKHRMKWVVCIHSIHVFGIHGHPRNHLMQ